MDLSYRPCSYWRSSSSCRLSSTCRPCSRTECLLCCPRKISADSLSCLPCRKADLDAQEQECIRKQHELLIKETEMRKKENFLKRMSLELRKKSKKKEQSVKKAAEELKRTRVKLVDALRQQAKGKVKKECKCLCGCRLTESSPTECLPSCLQEKYPESLSYHPCKKTDLNGQEQECIIKKQHELLIKEIKLREKENYLKCKSIELRKKSKKGEKSDKKAEEELKRTNMMLVDALRQQAKGKVKKECKCFCRCRLKTESSPTECLPSHPQDKSPESLSCLPCKKTDRDGQEQERMKKKQHELLLKEINLREKENDLKCKCLEFQKKSKKRDKSDKKAEKELKRTSMMLVHALRKQAKSKVKKECKCLWRCSLKKTCNNEKKPKFNPRKFLSNMLKLQPGPCACKQQNNCKQFQNANNTNYTNLCLQKLFDRPCTCDNFMMRNMVMPLSRFGPSCSPYNAAAGDCYLMSLRRTPQLWVYNLFPHFYPYYLSTKAQWRSLGHCFLFVAACLFWTPCLLCLALLKCFYCACCTEC